MTHLRKMMLEELQRRNYAKNTIDRYIFAVEDFSRGFQRPPDRLGPRHIREYQAELFTKRKLAANTVALYLAALRFFYTKTLKKSWSIAETPYPKRARRCLPAILSQEEVAQLIDAALTPFHRTVLMTLYATGVRRAELVCLKVTDVDSKRMVVHIKGGKGRKDRDVMLSLKLLKEIAGANEEIDHLARLVEDLHELALTEARELKLTISEEPLGPIVGSAARAAGLESDSRLRVILDNSLVVRGDAVRLRQVVLNILSNAARYTPTEGIITVRAFHRDRETVVEVHNTGSNLTPDEIAHVFDRFYRADPSRQRASGGTGLGLTIVKNLIEAQGGRVWSRSDDSGVSFAFALPSQT